MLSEEMISRLVLEIKRFLLADAMLLSRASDEQLMRRIAEIITVCMLQVPGAD